MSAATAVINFEEKTVPLYSDGGFAFRRHDVVVNIDSFQARDSGEYALEGEKLDMIYVSGGKYDREQFAELALYQDFESFEQSERVIKSFTLKYPFVKRETVETVTIPEYNYAGKDRKEISVNLPKDQYTLFDYRTQNEDKENEQEDK
jgi:hypothetical protein